MRIALICPSRGRPKRFAAMRDSALSLAADPSRVSVKLGIDRDDEAFDDYLQEIGPETSLTVFERRNSCPYLMNALALDSDADILVAASDDILWRTQGWDAEIEKAFEKHPDRILLVYFNDGRDRNKVEHFAISREWVKNVGYFMWPDFRHFCGDTWNEFIARHIGRCEYLKNVTAEHMHYKYGKADFDKSYAEKRAEPWAGSDTELLKIQSDRITRDAERLKKVCQ